MSSSAQAFYRLWKDDSIREKLFGFLDTEDICAVRTANAACCNLVTKRLFVRIHLTFTSSSFTKPCRIQALSRIGHHIERMTFSLAHSNGTFLPPLIHPMTGEEISFLYTPHTSMASSVTRPKYGNSELADILTQQYPPLFHAATNIPSFINAMTQMPNLRHLSVRTPGQDPAERYRRDVVDYALISLRISVERCALDKLSKLSLAVHPSAINYLRHGIGFGSVPSAARRWGQIRKLHITIDSWDFYGPAPGLDHLKIIDDYIRNFSSNLDKLSFTWHGRKGPCPLSLADDALFAAPRSSKKLFNEVTTLNSPLPAIPGVRRPIQFPRLRYMQVRNSTMNVTQVSDMVSSHRESVREFDFQNVAIVGGGSWDDALAPLTDDGEPSRSDRFRWRRSSLREHKSYEHSLGAIHGSGSDVAKPDEMQIRCTSAAMEASRALLDRLELELDHMPQVDCVDVGESASMLGNVNAAEEQLEEVATPKASEMPHLIRSAEPGFGKKQPCEYEMADDLASDIAAAREASLGFSTTIKKRRIKRRPRRDSERSLQQREDSGYHSEDSLKRTTTKESHQVQDSQTKENIVQPERQERRKRSDSLGSPAKSLKTETSDKSLHRKASHSSSHSHQRKQSKSSLRSRRGSNETAASLASDLVRRHSHNRDRNSIPEVIASDDETFDNYTHLPPLPELRSPTPPRPLNISAPCIASTSLPVLLQPTTYNPATTRTPVKRTNSSRSTDTGRGLTPPASASNVCATGYCDDGISPVQRNLELEASHLRMAEDAEARNTALKRAKEIVMAKLGVDGRNPLAAANDTLHQHSLSHAHRPQLKRSASAAVTALHLPCNVASGHGQRDDGHHFGGVSVSAGLAKLKDGLFGPAKSSYTVSQVQHHLMGGRERDRERILGGLQHPLLAHQSTVSSSSAMVPLVLSRN